MKMLRFTLSGKNAFFKKPEVNSYYYFTYSQIHKVALLGTFGAILGYGGYGQMERGKRNKNTPLSKGLPEFYEKLQTIQVSIIPNHPKAYTPKKIQSFNNSVGYASKEQGGNLIVKEQWLDHPSWDICVLLNHPEAEQLAESILSSRCVYMPYLGKNDHPADIFGAEVVHLAEDLREAMILNCLFPDHWVQSAEPEDEMESESEFKYQEMLPIRLDPVTNLYQLQRFVCTDEVVTKVQATVYRHKGQSIVFY